MKRVCVVAVVIVALAVAVPLVAGEGSKTCKASTQDCLNYMKANMADRGWVGIEYEPETMKILRVIEGSPAESAGFEKGDQLVALNGVDVGGDDAEALARIQKEHMKPGNRITYTVERAGMRRNIDVTLGAIPKEVFAQWIGAHMLEYHAEEIKLASNE